MLRRIAFAFSILGIALFLVACAGFEFTDAPVGEAPPVAQPGDDIEDDYEGDGFYRATNPRVEFVIEGYGTVVAELFPQVAPVTVENFVYLVEEGFYDGLTFHRILDGFMIQGGCPDGTGFGGSEQTIRGEFTANGFDNPLLHTPGTLSMARAEDFNGASSQFFIMHGYAPHLDGIHAGFGRVVEGFEVINAIAQSAEPTDANGSIAREYQPVMTVRRVR